MSDELSEEIVNDEGHPINESGEKLYEDQYGDKQTYDELDEAEQSYYDSNADDDFVEISTYCNSWNSEAATDWGSGPGGSLTEDDWDSLPVGD